jgi:hypothetical protein
VGAEAGQQWEKELSMGYFSNGTEGECYFEDYCSKCVHNGDGEGPMCPVWALHLELNYDECNKPESILHRLIPRTEGGLSNGQCKMFLAAPSMGLPLNHLREPKL